MSNITLHTKKSASRNYIVFVNIVRYLNFSTFSYLCRRQASAEQSRKSSIHYIKTELHETHEDDVSEAKVIQPNSQCYIMAASDTVLDVIYPSWLWRPQPPIYPSTLAELQTEWFLQGRGKSAVGQNVAAVTISFVRSLLSLDTREKTEVKIIQWLGLYHKKNYMNSI